MNIVLAKSRKGIRLRFTVESVRYEFQPFPCGKWENKRDRQLAAAIATKIENDILAGIFDSTLEKYRHKSLLDGVAVTQIAPKPKEIEVHWLELCDTWIENLCLSVHTVAGHYQVLRRQIEKSGNPILSEIDWLLDSQLSTSTFNRRLSMLRSLVQWCREKKLIDFDPLVKVVHRKAVIEEQQKQEENCRPFCQDEIARIVGLFRQKHPTYAPFVEFMFFTGVRTGEAVGLLWRHVDFGKRLISIKQSVTRERGGYKKVVSQPKTRQSIRTLRMSDRVFDLLVSIKPQETNLAEFVFKSPTGCVIDHGRFRACYWKPILEELGIPYRKPYTTRHTLLSEALEQGLSVPQVAQIAGHKDGRMILQHYGHVINQPQLPEI
jgi:integrase